MLVRHLPYPLVYLKYIYYTAIRLPSGFKEPDAQIFLTGRGPKDPTLVLEVGYSEGLSDLRLDARRWLSRTPPVRLSV